MLPKANRRRKLTLRRFITSQRVSATITSPIRLTFPIKSHDAALKAVQHVDIRIALPNERTPFSECGSNIPKTSQ